MHPELEDELLRLLAERDIRGVLLRYCRGVDRCDEALIASCFHEDARDDHGSWMARGGENIARQIVRLVKPGTDRPMHFVGNMLIELEGSSTAFAESYVLAFRASQRDGKPLHRCRAVRFVDRFEKRNGHWLISERVVVDEWNRIHEIGETQAGSDSWRYGSKDRDDPVYTIRQGSLARSGPNDPFAST